jgi:hypothetical protein
MPRRPGFLLPALLPVLLCVPVAFADVSGAQRQEVQHLLEFVRSTPCVIHRNDLAHTGAEAYPHILKKYDHYREQIRTTEEFIEYAASKSLLSGKPYTVSCAGRTPQTTGDWLREELALFRRRHPPAR